MLDSTTLLEKVDTVLASEGKAQPEKVEISDAELLEALNSLKNISSDFYFWEPTQTSGLLRPVKNLVLRIFHKFAKATLGKAIQKQQKFNDAAYLMLQRLSEK